MYWSRRWNALSPGHAVPLRKRLNGLETQLRRLVFHQAPLGEVGPILCERINDLRSVFRLLAQTRSHRILPDVIFRKLRAAVVSSQPVILRRALPSSSESSIQACVEDNTENHRRKRNVRLASTR